MGIQQTVKLTYRAPILKNKSKVTELLTLNVDDGRILTPIVFQLDYKTTTFKKVCKENIALTCGSSKKYLVQRYEIIWTYSSELYCNYIWHQYYESKVHTS